MLFGYLLMATWATVAPCHHTQSHQVPLLQQGNVEEPIDARTFHAMEASISLHSVLIGIGFGLAQTGWQPQLELGLALCVHQLLEGVAIGALGRRVGPTKLGRFEWGRCYAVFCLSLPLGAIVAVAVRAAVAFDDQTAEFRWTSGLLGAFAGGTLTHIGVEMLHGTDAERAGASFSAAAPVCQHVSGRSPKVAPAESAEEEEGRPKLHILHSPHCAPTPPDLFGHGSMLRTLLPRVCATFLGAALMGVLAIWA